MQQCDVWFWAVCRCKYRVYQNDWRGLEVDYIHKYGEETYKY